MKNGKNPASSNAPTKTIFRSKERRCRNLAGPQQGQGRDHGGLARCNYIEFQSGIICTCGRKRIGSFKLACPNPDRGTNEAMASQTNTNLVRRRTPKQISFGAWGRRGGTDQGPPRSSKPSHTPKPAVPNLSHWAGQWTLHTEQTHAQAYGCTETSPTAGPHFKGSRKQVNLKSTLVEASLPKGTSDNAYVDVSLGEAHAALQ